LWKNHDLTANAYATTWTDVDVDATASRRFGHLANDRMGLAAWLNATDEGRWKMDPETRASR
jgi:hypothetical protein